MVQEKVYNVPLRKSWLKVPRWRRSKRASNYLREFLLKHTNSDEVKLSRWINEAIWKNGGKNPPGKIRVKVTQDEEGLWKADLAELSQRAKRIIKKKEEIQKKRKEKKKKLEGIKEQMKKAKESKTEDQKKASEDKKKKAKITKKQEMQMNK